MAKFHRFSAPTYSNAPVGLGAPPAGVVSFDGVDYDLFNVATGAVGGGGSAFMDSYKSVGPNTGTYAVAFGEDASSSNANRGFRAIVENTDHLDDLFHRDIALPLVTSLATSDGTGTYASALLPAETFIGESPTYSLDDLFSVVDDNDREIIDPTTYAKVTVTGISEAIGSGFSVGVLTVTFSQIIPNGVQFKIYYSTRGNLATMPTDSLSYIRVRGAEEVSAEVQKALREIQAPVSVGGYPWNGPPITTLWDLARSGLDERYKRGTSSVVTAPAYHPVSIGFDVEGSGGWFSKSGDNAPGITGYSGLSKTGGVTTLYFGSSEHILGGTWNVLLQDTVDNTGANERSAATSGFVFLGGKKTSLYHASESSPGLFGYYVGARRSVDIGSVGAALRTNIVGDVVDLTGNTITLSAGNFTAIESGFPVSALAVGMDIIKVSVGGFFHHFVVTAITSSTIATVAMVDGTQVNFTPGTPGTIVEWYRTSNFVSDGSVSEFEAKWGGPSGSDLKGFVWAVPVTEEANAPLGDVVSPEHARFFAQDRSYGSVALAWGGYDQMSGFKYQEFSYLYGDGSIDVYSNARFRSYIQVDTDAVIDKRVLQKSQSTSLVSPTVDVSQSQFIYWNIGTQNGSTSTLTMLLTNLTSSAWDSGRVTVALRRESGCLANKVDFSIAGATSFLDPVDAMLQPIGTATDYWEVYEGTYMTADGTVSVFWKVSRYAA